MITAIASAGAAFKVTLPATQKGPVSGRLVITTIGPDSKMSAQSKPIDGPFWDEAQPCFGITIDNLTPGASVEFTDVCTWLVAKPSALPAGKYRAQARLVSDRQHSDWDSCPGSLSSPEVAFEIVADKDAVVELVLSQSPRVSPEINVGRVEFVKIKSELLSQFHKRDVEVRAGVVLPIDYDPKRTYPTVYHVAGFGGDHRGALRHANGTISAAAESPAGQLSRNAFEIFLDAESPNGHTLLADSENNGPRGAALVGELIPELEKRYPLAKTGAARVLRGHSSGGWATLWLVTEYPDVFGATWSSSPDSVDFRRFQLTDIYADTNMYFASDPAMPRYQSPGALHAATGSQVRELCSYRKLQRSKDAPTSVIATMSAMRENLQEEVLGPGNSSAQQWDSWQAVFGPRNADGNPAALFDPMTGVIDAKVAAGYRKYDIADRLRTNPKKFAPIFAQRVRLVVGELDNFFLNEAVALLKADLEANPVSDELVPEGRHGYIKILPGHDHGSIFGTPDIRNIPAEMTEHFVRIGLSPVHQAEKR